jgi:hypothetical protein
LILLILLFSTLVTAQLLSLRNLVSPGDCIGGEVCGIQPSVAVFNPATQQVVFNFDGSVYVQIASSPTGYEYIYTGGGCNNVTCGQKVFGSYASATFVNGIASFEVTLRI